MNEMTPADYAALSGNRGMGFGGDGLIWLIILFLFCFNGGWGNGVGNGGTDAYVQRGFDQNAVMNGITGLNNAVNAGFTGIQTQLCNGFAGVQNGFAQAEIAANSRQMADMNQQFALQSALQNCCCENRAATADLKYTVATENCADRAAVTNALQAVQAQNAANTQKILDQMCQDKIEAKNDLIAQLRSELMYARGQASQDVQTAAIQAGQRALASEVEQYVAPKSIPAYIMPNPNCCPNPNQYGCAAS